MTKHLEVLLLMGALLPATLHAAAPVPASRALRLLDARPAPTAARGAWGVEEATVLRADDPADSLYRAARAALSDGEFRRAATLFHRISERYPKSTHASDASYWEAFALYRVGDEPSLREAQRVLDAGRRRFPNAATRGDAATLATRIRGRLAQLGDPSATASVVDEAAGDDDHDADVDDEASAKRDKSAKGAKSGKAGRRGSGDPSCVGRDGDDSDMRMEALNALMQMDAERAMPILRQVLARRDACSEPLRRKAVFLVAQKNTGEAADILLAAARNDPDREVRSQAIFWMSQVGSERATAALDSILNSTGDEELRDKAIFALSQQNNSRARGTLRTFAKSGAPAGLRRRAVFWLGQQDRSAENATFLRTLFDSPAGAPLRDEIIQAAANAGEENDEWLLGIARDPKFNLEHRKKALFWLGQQRRVAASQFASLYDKLPDHEIKEHLIFVLSQRHESSAVDKLMDIARHDPDRSLRSKALFWLGQNNDPRVKQLLMEIINQ